jgi:hypothetical protein
VTKIVEEDLDYQKSEDGLVTFISDNWMNSVLAHKNHEKKAFTQIVLLSMLASCASMILDSN